jgi:hypothetical protein
MLTSSGPILPASVPPAILWQARQLPFLRWNAISLPCSTTDFSAALIVFGVKDKLPRTSATTLAVVNIVLADCRIASSLSVPIYIYRKGWNDDFLININDLKSTPDNF